MSESPQPDATDAGDAPAEDAFAEANRIAASFAFARNSGSDGDDESRARRLYRLRHSTAHVMAEAVLQLFPAAKVATGPAIEHGFYYDFDLPRPLVPSDLVDIERQMKKIVKRAFPFERAEVSVAQARELFEATAQGYKIEVLDKINVEQAPETVTLYRQGRFIDLCAGPHAASTKFCKHYKLLRTAAAYWRGDTERPMLQRIYGTAWETAADLESYLHFLEEAKKRNHKRIGVELDLFRFDALSPGACFWGPRGFITYRAFYDFWRGMNARRGYQEIASPILYKKALFEQSGHYQHYRKDMFTIQAGADEYCLKPMNCPDTFLYYNSKLHSFRELPLRIAEGSVLHRFEMAGVLNGLFRVRQFSQDDSHIFVSEDQLQSEIGEVLDIVRETYSLFELAYDFTLSTRPDDFMGEPVLWDKAEAALRDALVANGAPFVVAEGDGAFYGPKIDIQVTDCLGRKWQCATVQVDFQQPINFDMTYVASDNSRVRPIVIHRAIFGSFERFFGILLEHTGGALPTWLAPVQAVVVPISDKSLDYALQLRMKLEAAGVRVEVDDRNEKMGYKIREAELQKVPWMLVAGEREAESGTVNVRTYRDGTLGDMAVDEVIARIGERIATRAFDVEIKPLRSFDSGDEVLPGEEKEY